MVAAAWLFIVRPDAAPAQAEPSGYTDEERASCAGEIKVLSQMRLDRSSQQPVHDALVKSYEEAVERCLAPVRRAAEELRLQQASAAIKCPCQEGDFSFDDSEADTCKQYLVNVRRHRFSRPTGTSQRMRLDAQMALGDFKGCVSAMRGQIAHQREIEAQAEQRAAEKVRLAAAEDEIQQSRPAMVALLSAQLCINSAARKRTSAEIADEKRYSHRVGVLNLDHLEELKDELRIYDSKVNHTVAAFRERGSKPLACSKKEVHAIEVCFADKGESGCDSDRMRTFVDLLE